MKTITIFLALALPASAQQQRPDPGIAVTLTDGSTFVSTRIEDALVLKTAYGEQSVPVRDIRVARRLSSGGFALMARGLTVTGDLVPRDLELHTSIGRIKISTEEIRTLTSATSPRAMIDDATAALWWFPDVEGDASRDLVKGRPFGIADFSVGEDPSGKTCLTRRKAGALASTPSDRDLEILEGDYTLELRFRLPKLRRCYVMLLFLGSATDGSYDTMLNVAPNGQISMNSGRTGMGMAIAPQNLNWKPWNTLTIVQKAQPPCITAYLNGTRVQSLAALLPLGGTPDRPIHIGAPPCMGPNWEAPEALEFLRISKVARSEAEIAELEEGWDSFQPPAGAGPGVRLRDGAFLHGQLKGLADRTFRTRYGELKLSASSGGQLRLCPLRLRELDGARTEVATLVAQLGSGVVQEREAAAARLTALAEAAIPGLRDADTGGDREIQARVAELLRKFDDTGVSKRPVCDVLRLGDLVLQGWIDGDPFVLSTRRGDYRLPAGRIQEIELGRKEGRNRPLLVLEGGDVLEFTPAAGATAPLVTEFGTITVPLDEWRELGYMPEKKRWTLTAERLTAEGRLGGTASFDTPLGPLTLPLSDARELRGPRGTPKGNVSGGR